MAASAPLSSPCQALSPPPAGPRLPPPCSPTTRRVRARQRVSALAPPGKRMMRSSPVPPRMHFFRSEKHLPGFVQLSDELKANGAEVVACVSGESQPRCQGASWCIHVPSLASFCLPGSSWEQNFIRPACCAFLNVRGACASGSQRLCRNARVGLGAESGGKGVTAGRRRRLIQVPWGCACSCDWCMCCCTPDALNTTHESESVGQRGDWRAAANEQKLWGTL